jgi:hypothetical protein
MDATTSTAHSLCEMGGYGSGRYGGRPTVESAVRLDIDDMMQWGGIRAFARLAGEMRFNFYGDQIEVKFESRVGEPWESWLRLKYAMADCRTGEEVEIDDKIFLATTLPPFGGLRWWFVCPHQEGAQAVPAARRPSLLVAARV